MLCARELVFDNILGGPDLVVHARVVGALDFGGGFVNAQGCEDGVEDMAPEITQGPVTKVLPISPAPRVIDSALDVGAFRGDSKP